MRMILLCCFCLIATSCYAGEWIVDNATGCKFWNPKPEPNESINWSGKCAGGVANGQGVLHWYTNKPGSKGSRELVMTFEGFCKEGKFNGNGTLTFADGDKYVGEFKDHLPNGNGTFIWANGKKYVGEFKDGEQSGQGTLTFVNGDKYVGEIKDGKLNGNGTLTFVNGNKYVGEFKDGKQNGQGTLTFGKGDKYVGEFKDGKRSGQGTVTFVNGDKYVGEIKDGKLNGNGTFTWVDGDKYVGEFKDGNGSGQGTITWANGNKYVGEFKDNKPTENGTRIDAKGNKQGGENEMDGNQNAQASQVAIDATMQKAKEMYCKNSECKGFNVAGVRGYSLTAADKENGVNEHCNISLKWIQKDRSSPQWSDAGVVYSVYCKNGKCESNYENPI